MNIPDPGYRKAPDPDPIWWSFDEVEAEIRRRLCSIDTDVEEFRRKSNRTNTLF
jgi:hypothetical protein